MAPPSLEPLFAHRSHAPERMDELDLDGDELDRTLDSLERVNRWLGGRRVLLDSVARTLAEPAFAGLERPIVLADLGSGGGDGLRAVARWARRRGRSMRLIGIDASPHVLAQARARSRAHPEITFERADLLSDALSPTLAREGVDIVTLNLCLHHFEARRIESLLTRLRRAGVRVVLINDLHRHWLPYVLFYVYARALQLPHTAREDGLLSIRKAFRRKEMIAMARRAAARRFRLRWRWAFRYQLELWFQAAANSEGTAGGAA